MTYLSRFIKESDIIDWLLGHDVLHVVESRKGVYFNDYVSIENKSGKTIYVLVLGEQE